VPAPRRARAGNRLLVAVGAAAVVVAAVASAPGRALLGSVREAVGVEQAQRALFALPAEGRLLVVSPAGPWVVQPDGSRRRLGDWREASWSPFGRFVVAASSDELAAIDPQGHVRWSLARPRVRFPRWGGSRTDTRIAYLSGSRLHVVAGDGTGDVDQSGGPAAARVAPAWRPGARHVLAYATTRGRVYVLDTDSGSLLWRSASYARPRALAWSPDGTRLLLVTRDKVVVFRGGPRQAATVWIGGVVGAAFAPHGSAIAVARPRDVLLLTPKPVRVFAGAGRFTGVAWSPDGRWLLVPWAAADQWVFVRVKGEHRIRAVSNVARQFGGFPRVETWCCAR
jgi:WD40 repeat protein